MNILGINAFHGDASGALINDSELFYRQVSAVSAGSKVVGWFQGRTEFGPHALGNRSIVVDPRRADIKDIDDTSRPQTVSAATNPRYHALISEFERRTGVPLVLNSSFNEDEPIVATPIEAPACYLQTRMDVLALGSCVLTRPSA